MAREKPLAGQVALVTGSSRGIGLAIARRLALLGARLSLTARNAAPLEAAANDCRRDGADVIAVPADLRVGTEISRLLESTEGELGPVELLINNAGIGYFAPLQEAPESAWDQVLDTNLKAVFRLSRAVAPAMIRMGRGYIVNIASLAGKNTFAGGSIYCASKWGLLGLTGCMAEDLRRYGIRVCAVCPGSVATGFSPHQGRDRTKMLQPDDVAHAVAAILTQAPQSFISEVDLRPTLKP